MKTKQFIQSFFGALLGIIVYESFLDIEDPFENYWSNYILEVGLMILCIFAGLFVVNLIFKKLSVNNPKKDV